MAYHLLTGATGLLGQYLLCEALRKRMPVAVIARPLPSASGRQRIEAVLQRVEHEHGRSLPRPVVIEGQLDQPGLNLPLPQRRWIAKHCRAVIHSAASITFYADQQSGEPYRSNVTGTRHLLQLCQEAGVDQFHYVSTAYVCGQRSGPILERELDAGQTLGNDYERSKFEAEKLVRNAGFPAPPTIYRPSIIIGDSVTGYSSAFHGVYAALRIFWQLAHQDPAWADPRVPFTEQLDLHGDERKNLVPVDWAAAAIMHIVRHRVHHGQTYHVTHPSPPAVQTIGRAFGDAVAACMRVEQPSCTTGEPRAAGPENRSGELVGPQRTTDGEEEEPLTLTLSPAKPGERGQEGALPLAAQKHRERGQEGTLLPSKSGERAQDGPRGLPAAAQNWAPVNKEQLRQSLGVYEAYFRDDPEFDTTNLKRATAHLPCPPVEYDSLLRLAQAAIRANFGWPRAPTPQLEFDLERLMGPLANGGNRLAACPTKGEETSEDAGQALLHLELSGPGGEAWTIRFADGQPVSAEPGIGGETGGGVYATVTTFAAIMHGRVTIRQTMNHGQLVITGDPSSFGLIETLLESLCRVLHRRVRPGDGANGRGSVGSPIHRLAERIP